MKLKQGLIQIYTGSGKGKTTAAIGLANRAIAADLNVTFIQFLKHNTDKAAILKNPKINYKSFGLDYKKYGWLKKEKNITQSEHLEKFQKCIDEAWQYTKQTIQAGESDLIIMDELNLAIYFNLIHLDEIINTLNMKSKNTEIVITGRKAPQELLEIADLITEMKEIKHPYQKGIEARQGIDY